MPPPEVGVGHEAARIHRWPWRRRGVAAGGAGAAAGDAGDRVPHSADLARGGLDGCDYFARCQTCKVGPLPRRGAELASVRWSLASVSMRF
jgi:hypothetical protein